MGLKNKDGTTYKLSGPNPIMSEMAMWDKESKLILHNVGGKLISYEDATVVFHNQEPQVVKEIEAPVKEPEPVKAPIEEQPVIDKFDEIPIIESMEVPENPDAVDKIQVWCLPAYFRQYKDGDETVSKPRYGQKFLFEAILEEEGDFQILLYTTTDAVTEGSILFPKTYDKRWWRVTQTIKGEDGLIRIIGSLTHYHPEFSSQ